MKVNVATLKKISWLLKAMCLLSLALTGTSEKPASLSLSLHMSAFLSSLLKPENIFVVVLSS